MTRIDKADTSDLITIIRRFQFYPLHHLTLDGSVDHPVYCKKINKVIVRTNYVLDKLSTEHAQQAFIDSSKSFTVCVQRMHNDDNKRESSKALSERWSQYYLIKVTNCPLSSNMFTECI